MIKLEALSIVRKTLPDTHRVFPTSVNVTSSAGTQPATSEVGVGVFWTGIGVGLGSTVGVAVLADVLVGMMVGVIVEGAGVGVWLDSTVGEVGDGDPVSNGVKVNTGGTEACMASFCRLDSSIEEPGPRKQNQLLAVIASRTRSNPTRLARAGRCSGETSG